MAGTLVLTATIGSTFDDLFADINAGTDVVVRSAESVDSRVRRPSGAAVAESVLADRAGVSTACASPRATSAATPSTSASDGKAIGNPNRGAPTLGFAWSDDQALNPLRPGRGRGPDRP